MQILPFSWNCKCSPTLYNCIHRSQILISVLMSSCHFVFEGIRILHIGPWNEKDACHCRTIISCWACFPNIVVRSSYPFCWGGMKAEYSMQANHYNAPSSWAFPPPVPHLKLLQCHPRMNPTFCFNSSRISFPLSLF